MKFCDRLVLEDVTFLFCTLAVAGPYLFDTVCAIFRFHYAGEDIFAIYNILICVFTVLLIFLNFGINGFRVKKNKMVVLGMLFFYLVDGICRGLTQGYLFHLQTLGMRGLIFFAVWAVPAALAGIWIVENKRYLKFSKVIDIYMLFASLDGILAAIYYYLDGWTKRTATGAMYLDASYMCAFSLGLNLYLLLFAEKSQRYWFARTQVYKIVQFFLVPFQIGGILICGGRGALCLACGYMLFLGLYFARYYGKIRNNLIILIIALCIAAGFLDNPDFYNHFEIGIDRLKTLISTDGSLNYNASPQRILIYSSALELFRENPVLGYGMFGYRDVLGEKAHNIFLEYLLQGGIAFFLIKGFLLLYTLKKWYVMIKKYPETVYLGVLFFYPLILLLFSGSTINNTLYWFFLGAIISFDIKKHDRCGMDFSN